MEKFITDERTGLIPELVGDYYLVTGDEEPELEPIGIYGQRRPSALSSSEQTMLISLSVCDRQAGCAFAWD